MAHVVQRALAAGCRKLMVTGSDLVESQKAIELAEAYRTWTLLSLYCTQNSSIDPSTLQPVYVMRPSVCIHARQKLLKNIQTGPMHSYPRCGT